LRRPNILEGHLLRRPPLWASTGTKDPKKHLTLYTSRPWLRLSREHHTRGHIESARDDTDLGELLPTYGGISEEVLGRFAKAGVDIDALTAQLQSEEAECFVESWNDLKGVISSKAAALGKSTTPEAVS
jgi:transaldolase